MVLRMDHDLTEQEHRSKGETRKDRIRALHKEIRKPYQSTFGTR